MTAKRFERIYEDVDVFCRDHNPKGISQLIARDDYDKIVDLLNSLNDENEQLKKELFELRKDYILETYADNPIRRDEKLKALEKVFDLE